MLNNRIKLFMIVWGGGLLISSYGCEYFNAIGWMRDIIPGINSYAEATTVQNRCVANAIWIYAWIVAPIFIIWLMYIAYSVPIDESRTVKQRRYGLLFMICILIIFLLAAYYGIYDPYPGTDKGRWARFYREHESGVLIITFFIWAGGYSAFLMSALIITEITGFKSNR